MDSKPTTRYESLQAFREIGREERKPVFAEREGDTDDLLTQYLGRPKESNPRQKSSKLVNDPKTSNSTRTPLFEEFANLRQEMVADARNNRTNRWAEHSRSRERTKEREDAAKARRYRPEHDVGQYRISGDYSRQEDRVHHQKPDLLDRLMLSEQNQDLESLLPEDKPAPVSFHQVRDQVAFLNKVTYD